MSLTVVPSDAGRAFSLKYASFIDIKFNGNDFKNMYVGSVVSFTFLY
jgi:hypothetical protein